MEMAASVVRTSSVTKMKLDAILSAVVVEVWAADGLDAYAETDLLAMEGSVPPWMHAQPLHVMCMPAVGQRGLERVFV